MNFKLEIFGFKSFADKIEINFNGGITGIVIFNGCRKSNVADSIRWVLGEQSAASPRHSDDGRHLQRHREQEIPFLLQCHFLTTLQGFSPRLRRGGHLEKLFRSGESEYCMNRQACRLRDIQTFCGTAASAKRLFHNGQGRIDEILSANPRIGGRLRGGAAFQVQGAKN